MNVLVSGATGHTGKRLVPQLIEAGHSPIALVRDGSDPRRSPQDATRARATSPTFRRMFAKASTR